MALLASFARERQSRVFSVKLFLAGNFFAKQRGQCLQESCRNRAQGLARKVVAFEERAYDAGCNPVPYRVRDDDGIVFVHVLDSGCDFGACAKYRIFMLSMRKTHSEVY